MRDPPSYFGRSKNGQYPKSSDAQDAHQSVMLTEEDSGGHQYKTQSKWRNENEQELAYVNTQHLPLNIPVGFEPLGVSG